MSNNEDIILDENKYTQVDEKIKKPIFSRWWFKFLLGVLVAVIIVNITDKHYMEDNYLDVEWEKLELGKVLPKPDVEFKTKIDKNTNEELKVSLYQFNDQSYNDYVNKLKSAGFDIDILPTEEYQYVAYNNEDFKVDVKLEYDLLEVYLNKLKVLNEFIWPEIGPATKLPKPKSNIGFIERDSSSTFIATLGEMNKMQFDEYVEECKKVGFNVDFSKDENKFEGKNDKGDVLKVERTPVNRANIKLEIVDSSEVLTNNQNNLDNKVTNKVETNTTTKPQIKESKNNVASNTPANGKTEQIRPEFKAKMDQYEKFINEYVTFVDRLIASDGKDINLLKEYSDYMNKMMEFTEEIKKIDDMQLNQAEIDYFLKLDKELTDKVNKAVEKVK